MMKRWKELGIKLDPCSGVEDDYADFITTDEEVAHQEGFVPDWYDYEFGEDVKMVTNEMIWAEYFAGKEADSK
jgi:hypothetical protein